MRTPRPILLAAWVIILATTSAFAQTPAEIAAKVLVVINKRSPTSTSIGQYYMRQRAIPPGNLCTIDVPLEDDIEHPFYVSDIETPIGQCLTRKNLTESILYIVTTQDVPLRVGGTGSGAQIKNTAASVDSELTLLYQKLHGATFPSKAPSRIPSTRSATPHSVIRSSLSTW